MSGMIIEVSRSNGKSSSVPQRTLKTSMPQQRSPSSRNKESQWVAVEDKRRRRVAFEETAGGILRYPEDSEDLKVCVTELREQLGMSEEAGISMKQVAQQARNDNGQIFRNFQARRRRGMHCQLVQVERTAEKSGGVGKKMVSKY